MGWPGPSSTIELLPRYFPIEQLGLVLHVLGNTSGMAVGPEVHSTVLFEGVGIYVDAGWLPPIGGPAAPGLTFLVAGVEVQTIPRLWLFLETNTELARSAPLANHITPGVYATFDDAGNSELCVSVRLPATAPLQQSTLGVWWNQNVDLSPRR